MTFRLALALTALSTAAVAEVPQGRKNVPEFEPAFENQTRAPELPGRQVLNVTPVATGLTHPWGLAILPGGGYIVTERIGRLNHISATGKKTRIRGDLAIAVRGQGGLLDVAAADNFASSRRIYLTYVKNAKGGLATTAVTGVLTEDFTGLTDITEIFQQTPPINSGHHFGSRIVLDGDHAYITIGDRGSSETAQDLASATGKVVRVALDGTIPEDNPFAGRDDALPEVFSYGHRNPQGAALNPETGDLWTIEHGPKGGDELNRIEPGANYGWPVISYGENYNGSPVSRGQTQAQGMAQPVYYWDPVIAPGDFTFYQGDMFPDWQGDIIIASLNPGGLVRLDLDGDRVAGEKLHLRDIGRVRDVDVDADGSLLILTDDPDGGLYRVTPR